MKGGTLFALGVIMLSATVVVPEALAAMAPGPLTWSPPLLVDNVPTAAGAKVPVGEHPPAPSLQLHHGGAGKLKPPFQC